MAKAPAKKLLETECGIWSKHIEQIQKAAEELDFFLFARPTELDSTLLIKSGFSTKSMDIHDKSSNWGPMAGCVPCDPAFSKKEKGEPEPNKKGHPHGEAVVLQLSLPESLRRQLSGKKMVLTNEFKYKYYVSPDSSQLIPLGKKPQPARPEVYYYRAKGPVKNLFRHFCLIKAGDKWKVFWFVPEETTQSFGINPLKPNPLQLYPLYVWGYNGVPVTGDYDLWMVAPHLRWWKLHSHVLNIKDKHGGSAATLFINWLLKELNRRCERSDQPVFHHGAESQNYGFTQNLDDRVAMFTPAGTSRMVTRKEMPAVLNDLQNAGYMVVLNKRYGEEDPHFGGQEHPALTAFRNLGRATLARQRSKKALTSNNKFASLVWEAHAKNIESTVGPKVAEISGWNKERKKVQDFHKELSTLMETRIKEPEGLSKEDFGKNYKLLSNEFFMLQMELQKIMVRVTEGGGGSDLEALDDWFLKNIETLEKLSDELGPVPFADDIDISSFILRPNVKSKGGQNLYDRNA